MTQPNDPHDLNRFIDAQEGVYEQALSEIRSGRKQSHWMWFIFPQFDGLGFSSTTKKYSIKSLAEAEAYLKHPALGPRLRECTRLVMLVEARSAREILGSPDDMKFHSCLTLFAKAAPEDSLFRDALEKYFDGAEDPLTVQRL